MKYLAFLMAIFTPLASASECFNSSSTIERAQCHAKELEILDVTLNAEYKDAINELRKENPKVSEEEFRQAQRLWIKFVEADCSMKGKLFGGTSAWQAVEYQMCRKKYYEDRIYLFMMTANKAG